MRFQYPSTSWPFDSNCQLQTIIHAVPTQAAEAQRKKEHQEYEEEHQEDVEAPRRHRARAWGYQHVALMLLPEILVKSSCGNEIASDSCLGCIYFAYRLTFWYLNIELGARSLDHSWMFTVSWPILANLVIWCHLSYSGWLVARTPAKTRFAARSCTFVQIMDFMLCRSACPNLCALCGYVPK